LQNAEKGFASNHASNLDDTVLNMTEADSATCIKKTATDIHTSGTTAWSILQKQQPHPNHFQSIQGSLHAVFICMKLLFSGCFNSVQQIQLSTENTIY
jgi:hypothetical protein